MYSDDGAAEREEEEKEEEEVKRQNNLSIERDSVWRREHTHLQFR